MNLFEELKHKARTNPKTIILPESSDDRILQAADIIAEKKIARLILLGQRKKVLLKAKKLSLKNLENVKIIDHLKEDPIKQLSKAYYNLRKHKGLTIELAKKEIENPIYFAALMVRENFADGFVAGATFTSREVAKAAILGVGADKKIQTVSSSFLMVVPDCELGKDGIFMFADCGIIPTPCARQIANIAISTAALFKQLIQEEPKVAMLSYSSYGSGIGKSVEKMKEAVEIVKKLSPNLTIDGELQVDAAIVPQVAKIKAPVSSVKGNANVLIFPSLAAGNISYKLVQRLAKARAIGPILQGLLKPCSDLSRGCNVQDIVDAVTVNVVRAQ